MVIYQLRYSEKIIIQKHLILGDIVIPNPQACVVVLNMSASLSYRPEVDVPPFFFFFFTCIQVQQPKFFSQPPTQCDQVTPLHVYDTVYHKYNSVHCTVSVHALVRILGIINSNLLEYQVMKKKIIIQVYTKAYGSLKKKIIQYYAMPYAWQH